jgi:hypothetical protein
MTLEAARVMTKQADRVRRKGHLTFAVATSVAFVSCAQATGTSSGSQQQKPQSEKLMAQHPYTGMWITDDGHVRHQLLPNGRYDEARGDQESAYRGRYEVRGSHIEYWDDTGFTADGDFVDADTLHHGGMILRRRAAPGSSSNREATP